MRKPVDRYLEIASGLTGLTIETAERIVARLVKEGEIAADRAERVVHDLIAASREGNETLTGRVRDEVERAIDRFDLARMADLDRLEERMVKLVRSSGGSATTGNTSHDT